MLPLLLGDGLRLTLALSTDTRLTFERQRELPGGSVEIVYAVQEAFGTWPDGTDVVAPSPP